MIRPAPNVYVRLASLAVGLLVLLAAIAEPRLEAPAMETSATPTLAPADDPAALTAGSALFALNCAVCHGAGGKGDGPAAAGLNPAPADFTNPIHRAHTDADLIGWITNGVPGSAMPAFGGKLTDAQMRQIIVFLRSLSANSPVDPNAAPDPALCTVAPKSPSAFHTPNATPAAAPTPANAVGPDFAWPQGVAASQAEIDGITATVREFYACANASDYERQLALYTDRFIAPQFAALDEAGWQSTLDYAAAVKTPVAALDRQSIALISDVRRLPDGRVGAYVEALNPVNHPHQINAVIIFAEQNGRWLIDEVHEDPNNLLQPTATAGAAILPAAGIGTPVAQGGLIFNLARTSDGVSLTLTSPNGSLVTDANVQFVAEMMEMNMSATTASAGPSATGVYSAVIPFAMAGPWRVTVQATRPDGTTTGFSFLVPVT